MTTADRYAIFSLGFFAAGLIGFLFFEWTFLRLVGCAVLFVAAWLFGRLSDRAKRFSIGIDPRPLVRRP